MAMEIAIREVGMTFRASSDWDLERLLDLHFERGDEIEFTTEIAGRTVMFCASAPLGFAGAHGITEDNESVGDTGLLKPRKRRCNGPDVVLALRRSIKLATKEMEGK